MTYSITSLVPLNDGNSLPRFGLGVYESEPGEETYNAVLWALQVRLIISLLLPLRADGMDDRLGTDLLMVGSGTITNWIVVELSGTS
jgi:hypothetical protein